MSRNFSNIHRTSFFVFFGSVLLVVVVVVLVDRWSRSLRLPVLPVSSLLCSALLLLLPPPAKSKIGATIVSLSLSPPLSAPYTLNADADAHARSELLRPHSSLPLLILAPSS